MNAAGIAAHLGQGKEQKNGAGWATLCPCHDDHNPSLLVNDKPDGGITVKCMAGCDWRTVKDELAARGLIDPCSPAQPPRPSTSAGREDRPRWIYRDASEAPVGLVERVDQGPAKKSFCQYRRDAEVWVKGLAGMALPLYRLPEVLEAVKAGRVVYVAEGEKAAEALVKVGLEATTSPGGAGKWRPNHSEPLRGARVVILPDNDDPGRKHAETVARALVGLAAEVRVVKLPNVPPKGDAFDFLAAGGTREQIEALAGATPTVSTPAPHAARPSEFSACALLEMDFPPIHWVVDKIITEGLTILAGKPKLGKSWLALDLAMAVSCGGAVLGRPSEQGDALYLALEDPPRRLKSRLQLLARGPNEAGPGLHFATAWPSAEQGGIDALRKWMRAHPETRLVIIDTLAKFRPRQKANGSVYGQDYEAIAPLKDLADQYQAAVVVVHHVRKAEADDPFDRVSGSTGLTGAADATLILDRARGQADATLHVTGRDVEECALALTLDKATMRWQSLGAAEEYQHSAERRQILDVLRKATEPLSPKEITEALGNPKKHGSVKHLLLRMHADGLVASTLKGRYSIGQSGFLSSSSSPPSPCSPRSPRSPTSPGEWVNGADKAVHPEILSKDAGKPLAGERVNGVNGGALRPCYTCRSSNWWRPKQAPQRLVCATCHPPAFPELVAAEVPA